MNLEEFNHKLKEPVDIEKAREALRRFINHKATLRVPVSPDDDDMLIARSLEELKRTRESLEEVRFLIAASLEHIDGELGAEEKLGVVKVLLSKAL